MSRPIEEIQKEYNEQAAILGDLEYRMSKLTEDRERMISNMHNLNVEARKVQKKNAEEAVKEVTNEQPSQAE